MPWSVAPAPGHLRPDTQAWWVDVVEHYELDASALRLLEAVCDAWERYTDARQTLAAEGAFVPGRFGPRAHPAVGVERDARLQVARLLRELDLEGTPLPEPKRLPSRRAV